MSPRLCRAALALYPLAYRRRYGPEMLALIEDTRPGPRGALDLLRGALGAHMRPSSHVNGSLGDEDRTRLAACGVLACWILFSAASLAFYKTTENYGSGNFGLSFSHLAVTILAAVASAVVVATAGPFVAIALRQAPAGRKLRRACFLAFGSVGVFLTATGALVAVANSGKGISSDESAAILLVWAAIAASCAGVCWFAARRGLFALDLSRDRLNRVLVLAATVTVLMGLIALATLAYGAVVTFGSSGFAGQSNGPLGLLSVSASIWVQAAVMLAAIALAVRSMRGASASMAAAGRK